MAGFRGNNQKVRSDRGAALIEFAIILPILLILLFGIMEASWAFAQVNDIRHGAREGARLAAVDAGSAAVIAAQVCDRMERSGASSIEVSFATISGTGLRGDTGRINVALTYSSLTGFLDPLFEGSVYNSEIEFRLEQPVTGTAAWWGASTASC